MDPAHRTIEALWRIESPRLIAALARKTKDVGHAEELAQEALLAALQQWPRDGIPQNPGAWLMSTAKRRLIDEIRHQKMAAAKHEDLGRERDAAERETPDLDVALDDDFGGDDLLRLIFTACHPVLPTDARVALTLRLLAGLTTDEIARAFLVPEPTIAQRIVRAKKSLAEKQVPFDVPRGPDLFDRLASVLEVIYLLFNEGYSATAGDHWLRPALCEDALRLGRILAELMKNKPGEPEVLGLVALMELQASRTRARTTPSGEPILLLAQNRALWDQLLIHRGIAALERAQSLTPPLALPGPYALQAAIAACHARAATPDATDWPRIASLYSQLMTVTPSPIIELNRAVAISMATGPAEALGLVEALEAGGELNEYHLLYAVKGDLLEKLGRKQEAATVYRHAAAITRNAREQQLLEARAVQALNP
jgi:RNA polymerase sigma factor (sigma-70 family)